MFPSEMTTVQSKAANGQPGKFKHEKAKQPAKGPPLAKTVQQPTLQTSDSLKSNKKANRKRRQEEIAKTQGHSSPADATAPPAKKAKPNDRPPQSALGQAGTTQNARPVDIATLETSSTVEATSTQGQHADLSLKYDVTDMHIISSSHIQAKVTRILQTLATFSFVAPTKPNIVCGHAKAAVSSKLITIVEISKREIAKTGGKWFQYSSLGELKVVEEKKSDAIKGTGRRLGGKSDSMAVDGEDTTGEAGIQDVEEIEDSFESMKTPLERAIEGRPKIRAVPVMTIYLSRVRVDSLKKAYGEQTNALT